jgi:hypothetical protein
LSAAYVTVGLSVLAHGVTAAPLTRRYVSWFESHPADRRPAMESVPAAAHRWRRPTGIAETKPPPPASSRDADGTPPDHVTLESPA